MDGLKARVDSFKKSKRVKSPNKTTTLKWPHPRDFFSNPETLAEAGFYYDPSYDDPDNVTCFNCGKQLAGWEEDDDPYLVHFNKCSQICCWAIVQCGLKVDMDRSGKFVFPDKTRLPNHKNMEKARLETFTLGKGWIHDKTKNHGANSKSMARAGFAYTPQETGDDLASCLYCNVSLGGWDEDDDPMKEHRKRASKSDIICPFFEYTESRQTKPPSSRASSKSTSKPPSRTASRTVLTKTLDREFDDDSDAAQESNTKTPTQAHSRSRKSTAKTKSRSASRLGLKDIVEDEDKVTEAPPTVKKKTRSRTKSVAKPEAPPQSDLEVERPVEALPTIKSKTRARSKSVARSEPPPQSDGEDEVAIKTRRSARSRAKSKAPIEVETEEEEPIRKSSRSKSKVATDTKGDSVVPPQRKASRKSSKPKVVKEDSDKIEEVNAKPPRSTTTRKRTGSKARPKSPEVGSDAEQTLTAAPTNAKPKSLSQSVNDLFNEDIVLVDEYVPRPTLPPPIQPTIDKLSPLFIPKRTGDKASSGPINASTATPAGPPDKQAGKEKRKLGRPTKAKTTSEEKPKQANKVVEISSDEEEVEKVEKRDLPASKDAKTQTMPPTESSATVVNGLKDSEPHALENHQLIEDTMDVSMRDAEPVSQQIVTDIKQELYTAPSTPPKPTLRSEEPTHGNRPHLQSSDDNDKPEPHPNATLTPPTEPLYLPPLSRLPFMPLHTLTEAELDMTVEEWIRYQIEVEQDRFKRDGERELERFKKRAEEVRNVIEGV